MITIPFAVERSWVRQLAGMDWSTQQFMGTNWIITERRLSVDGDGRSEERLTFRFTDPIIGDEIAGGITRESLQDALRLIPLVQAQ